MNFGPVKKLIIQAEQALENGKDSHIGSNCLWNQHIQMLIKLSNKLADYQLKEVVFLFFFIVFNCNMFE